MNPQLRWLWEQIGLAADRRGDPTMCQGALQVRAPASPEQRAAAGGLVGGRRLHPTQSRRIDLEELTVKLRVRGPALTPGSVAAHALGRPLAARSRAAAERASLEQRLQNAFATLLADLPEDAPLKPDPGAVWPALRRAGWVARILANEHPERMLRNAVSVISRLPSPGSQIDRRRLASEAVSNPHALDEGTALAGLVLAILIAAGKVRPRQRARFAWAETGVDCDDVTGGLIAVGILPVGWTIPAGTPVTLPPRVLRTCRWPEPAPDAGWVFVTENPSIVTAAVDLGDRAADLRLLCTAGTPSALEIEALARLAAAGWRLAIRADFDEAGVAHVAALWKGVPGAAPWRMTPEDYLRSLTAAKDNAERLDVMKVPDSPWDPGLAAAMREQGVAGFEEALLPLLLEDMRHREVHPQPASPS